MESDATLVVLEGGLGPPSFLIALLVGRCGQCWAYGFVDRVWVCGLWLLSSSNATLVVLEGGLWPPSFLIALLVGWVWTMLDVWICG